MKTFFRNMTSRLFALLAAVTLAFAQGGAEAQPAYPFSQQELDQMLAPIALYPDALLSQILMASTYPLEVVEAARWSRARPGLSGDAAVRAAEGENWDPSVKSLVAFPRVLERMDENLQWTQALGDAFLDQQAQVMDTVQLLRRRAEAAGNLRSDDRVRVLDSGSGLMLEPLEPELVYVPYYDPLVVYGSWWWPAYPPFHWRPWTGYYARPGYARSFYWGPPVGISAGFFFGAFDWPLRQVRVVQVNNYYYNQTTARQASPSPRQGVIRPGAWHHDPGHRRGIVYRGIEAQQRFGMARTPQSAGNRVDATDPRRAAERTGVRPVASPVIRPEARSEGRRPNVRSPRETRVQPAPLAPPASAVQPAPADTRLDHRRDARAVQPAPLPPVTQPAPAAQRAPEMRSAPADNRYDHRRDTRGTLQPASSARPAPAMQSAPTDSRFDRRRDSRVTAQPAPPAPAMRHLPIAQPAPPTAVMQRMPIAQPAAPTPAMQRMPHAQPAPVVPPAPASNGIRQAARPEPGVRHEAQHAGEAAARQGAGAKAIARPKAVQ